MEGGGLQLFKYIILALHIWLNMGHIWSIGLLKCTILPLHIWLNMGHKYIYVHIWRCTKKVYSFSTTHNIWSLGLLKCTFLAHGDSNFFFLLLNCDYPETPRWWEAPTTRQCSPPWRRGLCLGRSPCWHWAVATGAPPMSCQRSYKSLCF